jgi:hypothetical protein
VKRSQIFFSSHAQQNPTAACTTRPTAPRSGCRACVNRTAPSGWQWAPRRPGGAHGVHSKKRVPHRWSNHCKAWSAFETLLAPDFQ